MGSYTLIIVATLVGFTLLAVLLLAPVYRFLEREERASEAWTPERVAERLREHRASSNGAEDYDAPEQRVKNG